MKLLSIIRFCTSGTGLALLLLARSCSGGQPDFYQASEWNQYGRGTVQSASETITITDCFLAAKQNFENGQISIQARAPKDVKEVQIWAGFRCKDRDHRYVVALRGGNNNDVYLARYAPDGQAEFLGEAPLDFQPQPGEWHTLRIIAEKRRILVFVDGDILPRLNVVDNHAGWKRGGVVLGGGWLPVEFRGLKIEPVDPAELAAIGDQVWKGRFVDREAQRVLQRAEYQPLKVPAISALRAEISLEGNWLFKPDQELASSISPATLDYNDESWHIMHVPDMWTPLWAWLYGEKGGWVGDAQEPGGTKGISDRYRAIELARVNNYTFDWEKTGGAWYRHYVVLPPSVAGKHVEVCFDAIAKISEIFVNGQKVGSKAGMFSEIRCDISHVVKPGTNVLAVHVLRNFTNSEASSKVEAVAVSVPVTSEMLHSLPHGMYDSDPGGIWQPVKLAITSPSRVDDVFIQPRLDGATMDVRISGDSPPPGPLELTYTIRDWKDRSVLYQAAEAQAVKLDDSGKAAVKVVTPGLHPKLWSPQSPNLYILELELKMGGKLIDRHETRFGFRTFTVAKNQFLLNGEPYWLRGGNYFPHPLRPNDRDLALRMMKLAREGNVTVTRSHVGPMSRTWLDAADEMGMAISYEGNWPWLMINGEVPDKNLLQVWRDEMVSMMRTDRNHPSVLMWTVNNEMKFYAEDRKDKPRLKRKWAVLSDMVKTMRRIDPTRPVVADSAYVRRENMSDYESLVKPNHFDDGDIDDTHRYFGWYNPSFFHFSDGQFGKSLATEDRPLISQELSTGYPRNDDGHPCRFYLFKHFTPQALVGQDAYEDRDPQIFLERQAFMTKELVETIRRTNHREISGIMPFAYLTWFKDVYDAKRVMPWPAYGALKTAMQPVLVSAELFGRHFYAGEMLHRRVCVVNDAEDFKPLPPAQLTWQIKSGDQILAEGEQDVPPVPYYQSCWFDTGFALPRELPAGRVDAKLVLKLKAGGQTLSENSYDILLATRQWAMGRLSSELPHTLLFDPEKKFPDLKAPSLNALTEIAASNAKLLIIADLTNAKEVDLQAVRQFAEHGGNVLILGGTQQVQKLLPEQIKTTHSKKGEIVTMHISESPVFDGIEWRDLAWFETGNRQLPYACRGVFVVNPACGDVTVLADQCDFHGYLRRPNDLHQYAGSPLLESRFGQGKILASEMQLEARASDPVAGKLLENMVGYLGDVVNLATNRLNPDASR